MVVTFDSLLALIAFVISVLVGWFAWQMRSELLSLRSEMGDLRKKYNSLVLEYWRVMGENTWLRQQLRERGIEIPPLPDELRPQMDANGNISIMITERGGVQVAGDLKAERDVVGGNSHVGGDSTLNKR